MANITIIYHRTFRYYEDCDVSWSLMFGVRQHPEEFTFFYDEDTIGAFLIARY